MIVKEEKTIIKVLKSFPISKIFSLKNFLVNGDLVIQLPNVASCWVPLDSVEF